MLLPFRRYAEFSGRSRRKEFWWFAVFNMIAYGIMTVILFGSAASMATLTQASSDPAVVVKALFFSGSGLLLAAYGLVVLIPGIAVTVRRLHDRDMSGWWYLGFIALSFIPLVGALASLALFVITLLPGTMGPNRFGADPKDPTGAAVFG